MTCVAVAVDGDVTTRAAHSLAGHPGVDEVVLLEPATSTEFRSVEDASECDVVVATGRGEEQTTAAGVPMVVVGPDLELPGYHTASIDGLALALAVGVGDVETVAVADPDRDTGDLPVVFPFPIDAALASETYVDGRRVLAAPSADLAAALVTGSRLHRVVMDDPAFLAGIALAAAAVVVLEDQPTGPTPIWARAAAYLRAAGAMGLVIGERPADE